MTNIDFYVLSSSRPEARLHFACRLARKAWEQNRRVYLHCADEAAVGAMDELLWSFRPDSFLPHAPHADQPNEVIVCGCGDTPDPHNDFLINLSNDTPEFFSRFNRLAEILVEHDPILVPARERFRFYRKRGYPLNTHQIRIAG
ncbi:DNA polymerase III subunit chi [Halopseudomonas litoralis]|nr:DNA polymerase III subunit chi [Halopseudomonas litoralis]